MTIEQLLALPGDDLANIPDVDLDEYLKPYLPATRPGNVPHVTNIMAEKMQALMPPAMRAQIEAAMVRRKEAKVFGAAKKKI